MRRRNAFVWNCVTTSSNAQRVSKSRISGEVMMWMNLCISRRGLSENTFITEISVDTVKNEPLTCFSDHLSSWTSRDMRKMNLMMSGIRVNYRTLTTMHRGSPEVCKSILLQRGSCLIIKWLIARRFFGTQSHPSRPNWSKFGIWNSGNLSAIWNSVNFRKFLTNFHHNRSENVDAHKQFATFINTSATLTTTMTEYI